MQPQSYSLTTLTKSQSHSGAQRVYGKCYGPHRQQITSNSKTGSKM